MSEKCPTCGDIKDSEFGYSKYGSPQDEVLLPRSRNELKEIISNVSSRGDALYQCPECQSYFHYNLDYEFLVNGSEDSETLTRISAEQAADLKKTIEQKKR